MVLTSSSKGRNSRRFFNRTGALASFFSDTINPPPQTSFMISMRIVFSFASIHPVRNMARDEITDRRMALSTSS